uniref:Uncharacterized protein n=1 Tax=Angiostrongylus cantonensis TaxID=6313 RepID=A0A0K0DJM6_ANGCA
MDDKVDTVVVAVSAVADKVVDSSVRIAADTIVVVVRQPNIHPCRHSCIVDTHFDLHDTVDTVVAEEHGRQSLSKQFTR